MSPQITTIGGYRRDLAPDPPFGQHALDVMMLHGGLTPRTFALGTETDRHLGHEHRRTNRIVYVIFRKRIWNYPPDALDQDLMRAKALRPLCRPEQAVRSLDTGLPESNDDIYGGRCPHLHESAARSRESWLLR